MSKRVSFECAVEDIDSLHNEIEKYKELHLAQLLKEREITKQDILDAIDRNIVCYDKDAKSGVFSERLFLIMIKIALVNRSIDNPPITNYHFWLENKSDADKEIEEDAEFISAYELDVAKIYDEEKCCRPNRKNKLAVMVCNNGEVLLGAY